MESCDALEKIKQLKQNMTAADAIVIGAGAGLSTAGRLSYTGQRFEKNFADFIERYQFRDMYSATFYNYDSLEEYWAYMSRHINTNRYDAPVCKPHIDLLELVKDKNYFVITTNVDHQFQKAGFDKNKLFYTQGDYGLWQCSTPCHDHTYDNEKTVCQMVNEQKNLRIPTELVPRCPKCGEPMTMNLRCDNTFVQDEGWYKAAEQYEDFLRKYETGNILYLELGVGNNTPGIIKYPFWKMTTTNQNATYGCINLHEAVCPKTIEKQAICITEDIDQILSILIEIEK